VLCTLLFLIGYSFFIRLYLAIISGESPSKTKQMGRQFRESLLLALQRQAAEMAMAQESQAILVGWLDLQTLRHRDG
jgi:hypothetical protein